MKIYRVKRRRWGLLVTGVFIAFIFAYLPEGSSTQVRIALSRHLIAEAWAETIRGGASVLPWPGADSWPVARLYFPTLDRDIIVLAGARGPGPSLGPRHLDGTSPPGAAGASIIVDQRVDGFAVLKDLKQNDPVRLQRDDGRWINYRVTGAAISDDTVTQAPPRQPVLTSRLTLIADLPGDSAGPRGLRRYRVFAEEVGMAPASAAISVSSNRRP